MVAAGVVAEITPAGIDGDTVFGDEAEHVGVFVPGVGEGRHGGEGFREKAGVVAFHERHVFADHGLEFLLIEDAIVFGGLLGGEESEHGSGEDDALAEFGDGVAFGRGGEASGEAVGDGQGLGEIEGTDEVEADGLPAGTGEGGGVAGVAADGFDMQDFVHIKVKEGGEGDHHHHEGHEDEGLAGFAMEGGIHVIPDSSPRGRRGGPLCGCGCCRRRRRPAGRACAGGSPAAQRPRR